MSKQRKWIRKAERLINSFQLEIWMAAIFSTFFFLATHLRYATDQIGWVALVIYICVAVLYRSVRVQKEREIIKLHAEVDSNIQRLRRLLEKAQIEQRKQIKQKHELEWMTQEVENSREKLLAMGDLKNKFMATLSHELRTPVTAIQESLNLIVEEVAGPVRPKQKRFLEIAQQNILRLTVLLNNLLDLSQLESGGMKPNLARTSLGPMVREALNIESPKARKKEIELIQDIRADLSAVLVDRQRVVQVISELLENAIKFTPTGGKVGVSARHLKDTKEVEVCVWDTGAGIAAEHVDQLFGGLHQLKRKEDFISPGAGLGLAVCKAIVTQMGGSIWVESQHGQGARFYFTLLCYSDGALLRSYFQSSVQDALLRNASLMLLGVQICDYRMLSERFGKRAVEDVLRDVRGVIIPCFRAEDRAATDLKTGICYVLMVSTNGDLRTRFQKVDEYLTGKTFFVGKQSLDLQFSYGVAHFPKDGEDLEKLLVCINSQLKAGGIDIRTIPLDGAA